MPPIKPSRSAVGPANVEPEWAWAWRGLTSAMPLDEGNSRPFDIVQNVYADLLSEAQWSTSKSGLAVQCHTAFDRIELNSAAFTYDVGTAAILFIGTGTPNQYGKYVVSSGPGDEWQLYRENANTAISARAGGSSVVSWIGVPDMFDGDSHLIVWEWDSVNDEMELFVDGVSYGVQAATMGTITPLSPIMYGDFDDGNRPIGGTFVVTYGWNRLLTAGEVQALTCDPFGPIRPRILKPAEVSADSDAFVTKVFVP